jgi:hypothetical protein
VGIYKGTEVTLRFIPTIKTGELSAGLFGLGVKHSIKQWIPAIKEQKIWDWSAIAGFTTFNAGYAFSKPMLAVDDSAYNPDPTVQYNNQKIDFTGTGFMIGTIMSAQLGLSALNITPYVGVNYAYSKVALTMGGDYPIVVPNTEYDGGLTPGPQHDRTTRIMRVTDPITIEGTLSNLRVNAGMRIKLALLTIGGEYSIATSGYNSATVNVALNLQSIVPFKM